MLEPIYVNPSLSDGRKREDEIVDEAAEKKPAVSPNVVEVETYVPVGVKGQAAEEMVTGEEPMMTPWEQLEPPEQERVVVATEPSLAGEPEVVVQYES